MRNKYIVTRTKDNTLCHFGIKGMKWGVRRYQNKDGTLTAAGKKRALKKDVKSLRKQYKETHAATVKYDSQAAYFDAAGSKISGLSKKDVRQMHDTAVDKSRRMRQMDKEFLNKWGETTISEINKKTTKSGEKYVDYILSMPEHRKKYSEGAKDVLPYMFGPGNPEEEPKNYYPAIKYKK